MPEKTIKVSTLKVMINSEYQRAERQYNTYRQAGNYRNADYYTAKMSTLIDLAAQIEQETGAVIFDDQQVEPCDNTFDGFLQETGLQSTPVISITTASAAL